MRTKEGAPAWTAEGPNSPSRTTAHTTTTPIRAHRSLIRRDPCDLCDSVGRETETGFHFCRANPHGDFECEAALACQRIEEVAAEAAEQIATIADPEMRDEIAEGAAGGFANALYVQGRGAEFDDEAFCELCGCGKQVAA
jgi:hypothetical protein